MSGGSYDYICYKMEDAARTLCGKTQPPYRQAFGMLMKKCAKAMHDIEWVDSNDMSEGDDEASIMQCICFSQVLACTVKEAEKIQLELEKLIKLAKQNDRETNRICAS